MVEASRAASDRRRLVGLWRDLGIPWTDETEDAEDHRGAYLLPEGLEIGAVLGGPGISHYFFDAAGTFVGYGAMDVYETDYFVERGREGASPVDHEERRVRLEGRYVGVPKVHVLSGEAGALLHFSELPGAFEGGRYDGPADIEEGDVLRVTVGGESADYEVSRVVAAPDEEGRLLDAQRLRASAEAGG